jgi:hypothetical protein
MFFKCVYILIDLIELVYYHLNSSSGILSILFSLLLENYNVTFRYHCSLFFHTSCMRFTDVLDHVSLSLFMSGLNSKWLLPEDVSWGFCLAYNVNFVSG